MKIWYLIMLAQIGYSGIVLEVIWTYDVYFFLILQVYSYYSTFICLSAILNSQYEQVISVVIIIIAYVARWLLSMILLKGDLTSSTGMN